MKAFAAFLTAVLCSLTVQADGLLLLENKLLVCYRDLIPIWKDYCRHGPEYDYHCPFYKIYKNCTHVIVRSSGVVDVNTALYTGYQGEGYTSYDYYNYSLKTPPVKLQNLNPLNSEFIDGPQVVSTKIGRMRLIKSAIESLKKNRYEGLDVVVEEEYLEDIKQLLLEMRPEFDKNDLVLTALFPATLRKQVDLSNLARHLDFISIKSFRDTNRGPVTMLSSPLYSEEGWSVDYSVNMYINMGVPSEKIVVGIPTFAAIQQLEHPDFNFLGSNAWEKDRQGINISEDGQIELGEVAKHSEKGIFRRDIVSGAPYISDYFQWISYDDEISVKAKVSYMKENELGGLMLWPSNNEMQRSANHPEEYRLPFTDIINATLGEGK